MNRITFILSERKFGQQGGWAGQSA